MENIDGIRRRMENEISKFDRKVPESYTTPGFARPQVLHEFHFLLKNATFVTFYSDMVGLKNR